LVVALAVALTAGLAAGLASSPAVLALPPLAALVGFALATGTVSGLPALAARRARASAPSLPSAPARESRLAVGAYSAAMLASCALGQAVTGLLAGRYAVGFGGLGLAAAGFAAILLVWSVLLRMK
jgi:hypothetical protein